MPSSGDLPDPGIEPASPASPASASRFFSTEPLGSLGMHTSHQSPGEVDLLTRDPTLRSLDQGCGPIGPAVKLRPPG